MDQPESHLDKGNEGEVSKDKAVGMDPVDPVDPSPSEPGAKPEVLPYAGGKKVGKGQLSNKWPIARREKKEEVEGMAERFRKAHEPANAASGKNSTRGKGGRVLGRKPPWLNRKHNASSDEKHGGKGGSPLEKHGKHGESSEEKQCKFPEHMMADGMLGKKHASAEEKHGKHGKHHASSEEKHGKNGKHAFTEEKYGKYEKHGKYSPSKSPKPLGKEGSNKEKKKYTWKLEEKGACNFTIDCMRNVKVCLGIGDGHCICQFETCITEGGPRYRGKQCQDGDTSPCNCKPGEPCYCNYGYCRHSTRECYSDEKKDDEDCRKLPKCQGQKCVCFGLRCEPENFDPKSISRFAHFDY